MHQWDWSDLLVASASDAPWMQLAIAFFHRSPIARRIIGCIITYYNQIRENPFCAQECLSKKKEGILDMQ